MKKLLDWCITTIFLFLFFALGCYWAFETCIFKIFGWALMIISAISILTHAINLIKRR